MSELSKISFLYDTEATEEVVIVIISKEAGF